jgi:outer membrane protein OmpA-like peptidoglycan-associated protein
VIKRVRYLSAALGLCAAVGGYQPPGADACAQGEAYYHQAREAESPAQRLAYLNQAIERCPTFAAWYTAGRTHLELQQPAAALAAFQQARELAASGRPEGLALGREGEAYQALGQDVQAVVAVERAMEQFETAPPAWLVDLRRTLDRATVGQLVSAETIKRTWRALRSFGVTPKVRVRVQFAYDSYALSAQGRRQVRELGKALLAFQDEGYRVLVIGHTDKRGTAAYNARLSKRRARTVVNALGREFSGLAGLLTAQGRGESELLYAGDSEEDHYLNRRVEVQWVR